MARKSLLIAPIVVVALVVPPADASARRKNWKTDDVAKVTPSRADEVRPAGVGDGRRMR